MVPQVTPTGGVPPLHPLDEDMLREGRKGGRKRESEGGRRGREEGIKRGEGKKGGEGMKRERERERGGERH